MSFWSKSDPVTENPVCSFCGKTRREVLKLVAGPGVYICNECVILSSEVIAGDLPAFPDVVPSAADLAVALRAGLIGQPEAVRTVASALAVHLAGGSDGPRGPVVCIVGPAGSGKSTLARAIVDALPVPATAAALNRVTASGYVGEDLENLLFPLFEQAAYGSELARRGVVVLDALQEVAGHMPPPGSRQDVGGAAVQRHLVSLLDGVTLEVSQASPRHPHAAAQRLETRHTGVVLLASVDAPATEPRALREQLTGLGLRGDVVARIDLVVPLQRRNAPELAEVWSAMWAEGAAIRGQLGAEPEVEPEAVSHLAACAAGSPDGAWVLHRARHALHAWLATGSSRPRVTVDQLEALGVG